jgi:proline dehydrogenase
MAKKQKVSDEVVAEAMQVAKATQRPGQTKEQTKLIAQGIQKGIEEYKKRNKEKSRALDKQKRKLQQAQRSSIETDEVETESTVVYQQSKLGWGLLLVSWLGFAAYVVTLNS